MRTETAPGREPLFRATDTHLVVSMRALSGLLILLAFVGGYLAALGLSDAYATLGGPGTREGTIITVAIAVGATAVLGVLGYGQVLRRRVRRAARTITVEPGVTPDADQ